MNIRRMADVFCGCGTTAFEARRNSIDFWGCDINPVATLIARTKSHSYDSAKLREYFAAITSTYAPESVSDDEMRTVNARLRYWHPDNEIKNLLALKKAIQSSVPSQSHAYRDFFYCAFSNILKPTSKWLTKSIKPQLDPDKQPADAIACFQRQFDFMARANEDARPATSTSRIHTLNFLQFKAPRPFADLIVTSPPYVTSYEYADIHQLSLLWLEYTDDYRMLREGTIGSKYHKQISVENCKRNIGKKASAAVGALQAAEKDKAASVAKYFADMREAVFNCCRIIRPNGMAVFVIGNTEYKGVLIDNMQNLTESMKDAGFADVRVMRRTISRKTLTPFRDKRGRFSADSRSRHVYAEEFIVTGRKPA